MTKRRLSILILSLGTLTGPANSGWAAELPAPSGPLPTVRVHGPGTGILLLIGVAGVLLLHRFVK
jgi:hypothetical protein